MSRKDPKFPSSAEDGSIEAPVSRGHFVGLQCGFPSSAEDGSIEADRLSVRNHFNASFPSSAEDGSIEAQPVDMRPPRAAARFRPQLRTAPLKQGVPGIRRSFTILFPSSAEDGSIEAGKSGFFANAYSRFRPQLRTAPLKP